MAEPDKKKAGYDDRYAIPENMSRSRTQAIAWPQSV
jgi:hypothetical protein